MIRRNRRELRPLLTAALLAGSCCAPALAAGLQALPSTYTSTIVDWPKGKTGTVKIGTYASGTVDANGRFSIVLPTAEQVGPELRSFSDLFAERSTARSDEVCKGQGTSAPTNARYQDFDLEATIDGGSPISLKLNSDPRMPSRVGLRSSYLLYFDVPTVLDGSFTCAGANFISTFKGRFPAGWTLPSDMVTAISGDGVYSDLLTADALPTNVTWHLYNLVTGIGVGLAPVVVGPPGVNIIRVTPLAPADKAGVKVNDLVVEVNGRNVTRLPFNDVTALIRGDPGTTVTLGVMRGSETTIRRISITRALVQVP